MFEKDYRFSTSNVTSISSVCDEELARFIRESDYIRHETLRRTWAIPSMKYKSLKWANRYYNHFRAQVIAEIEKKKEEPMNETTEKIREIIEEAETMKNAYFFRPDTHASGRRAYEKKHSHDVVTWEEGGHVYSASFTVTCSCKNVYARGEYTRDGNKTTLTAIKNSFKRLTK